MKLAEDLDQICCFLCVGKGQVVTVLLRISLVLNKDDIQSCQTQCWSMCSYIHFPQLQSASQNSHYLQSIVTHCPCYPFYMARSHNQTKPKTTRSLLKRCISENFETTSLQIQIQLSAKVTLAPASILQKWHWFLHHMPISTIFHQVTLVIGQDSKTTSMNSSRNLWDIDMFIDRSGGFTCIFMLR